MRKLISLLTLLFVVNVSLAQTGAISGQVTDEKNEPVIGAYVEVSINGTTTSATNTDFDGNYFIKPLKAGKYDARVTYTGYKTYITQDIIVNIDKTTIVNFKLESNTQELEEVQVKAYKVPLIEKQYGASPTRTSQQIERMPTRYTATMAATAPGVYQQGMVAPHDNTVYYNPSTESYKKVAENDFMMVQNSPLSTLSVDVDRASYSNIRRFLNNGKKPPADAVRIEEMINYFNYHYPQPEGEDPIAIVTEMIDCPWQKDHKLLHVGMQAKTIDTKKLPPSNLVFLIDVSGSMSDYNKLPLVKTALKMLVDNLRAKDKVSLVVYAGSAGVVLPATSGDKKEEIKEAINRLQSGGSTAGGAGIKLAYQIAIDNYLEDGNNRVILATDGDFNVGVSGDNELEELITKQREKGVFLTCLGFGMGNYKDSKMEVLADKGNGNYAYIDNEEEAKKTLVKEFGGTILTIAKDVKAQIEFNPNKVKAYRLIGYENRLLNAEDFKDDTKDAGEMGSGHTVTILYEIIPVGVNCEHVREASDLKYQRPVAAADGELATIKFRYKKPDGHKSKEMVHPIADAISNGTDNVRFSSAVALFGMLLKDSQYKGDGNYDKVLALAKNGLGSDKEGYRSEFMKLVRKAR